MRTRFHQNLMFLKNHRKKIFAIAGVATSTAGLIAYKKTIQRNEQFHEAYKKFSTRVQSRTSHHSIQSLFLENCKTKYLSSNNSVKTKQQSVEITTQLDATHYGAPLITHEDGSRSELNGLSCTSWQDFIKSSSNEVYISFGHRKAFSATNPLQFTHAIVYVSDSEGNHAIFGYSSNKNNFIINDSANTSVSRLYTLYPDLTIKGNKEQMHELFKRIEHFSLQRYTAIGCNCYSPLISGLIEAKEIGFTVPRDFNDSLLIVIPSEQNYGMGITSNRYLKPLSESAVHRSQLFFEKMKEKAIQKLDKAIETFKNKR